MLGRYLFTVCLWTLRDSLLYMVCAQLRHINTPVSLGSNKDSTTYVLSIEVFVYKDFYPTTFSYIAPSLNRLSQVS